MKILIAPSGLKESVEPLEAVERISAGVRKVYPAAKIDGIPMVDGGEGTTKTLVELTDGTLVETTVTGPVGEKVRSFIGLLGGDGPKTAVVEMAAAAGLRLVPQDRRDPQLTTTHGVGELIKLALDQEGVERILVGCGDSGTNDAGIGMAQALGAKLLDCDGKELGFGAIHIPKLARIDISGLHPKLASVRIDAALNAKNILCGPKSVARVYGPQKGATPQQVEEMALALDHFARIVQRDVGKDVALMKGGGASGGLGAGLFAFLGANLHPRFDVMMEYLGLEAAMSQADLILTAEGAIDYQTPQGKVPALLAERAVEWGIPVVVLAGMIGSGAEDNYNAGITAFESIQTQPVDLSFAIQNGGMLLEKSAERTMRFIKAGTMISERQLGSPPRDTGRKIAEGYVDESQPYRLQNGIIADVAADVHRVDHKVKTNFKNYRRLGFSHGIPRLERWSRNFHKIWKKQHSEPKMDSTEKTETADSTSLEDSCESVTTKVITST